MPGGFPWAQCRSTCRAWFLAIRTLSMVTAGRSPAANSELNAILATIPSDYLSAAGVAGEAVGACPRLDGHADGLAGLGVDDRRR